MKTKIKLGLLLIGLAVSSTAMASVKIGVVDMQKAIQATKAGKKAQAKLKAEFEKRKKDLKKRENDLKKMSEDLTKKKLLLSDKVKIQKQQELQREMLKYRELVGKNQMEISRKERDLVAPIAKKLQKIIKQIAKDEKYTLVIQKSEQVQNILYTDKSVDLTDKVVKSFEKSK